MSGSELLEVQTGSFRTGTRLKGNVQAAELSVVGLSSL